METELTKKEKEVYKFFACKGNTAKEAAEYFHISPNTIKEYLQKIYQKLHINSKIELVRHYFNNLL